EGFLHGNDVLADAEFSTEPLLNVGRRRKVIGMRVGFDQPPNSELIELNIADDRVSRFIADAPSGVVDVHHGVDDSTRQRGGILRHIADRVRLWVKKGSNLRHNGHGYWIAHQAVSSCLWDRSSWSCQLDCYKMKRSAAMTLAVPHTSALGNIRRIC